MDGTVQQHYQHSVPGEDAKGHRISLTWRWIGKHIMGCRCLAPAQERSSQKSERTQQAFEAARKFEGARPGWAFKLGDHGLGYYCESGDRQPPEGASAASS